MSVSLTIIKSIDLTIGFNFFYVDCTHINGNYLKDVVLNCDICSQMQFTPLHFDECISMENMYYVTIVYRWVNARKM